jgi:protein transport protein SEC61 subunit gamma and related proteins
VKLFKRKKKIDDNRSLIEKARDLQERIEAKRGRIGKGKYGRVLKMTRKPTNEEFMKTSKITFAGILIIGAIGFAIFLVAELVAPWIAEILGIGV